MDFFKSVLLQSACLLLRLLRQTYVLMLFFSPSGSKYVSAFALPDLISATCNIFTVVCHIPKHILQILIAIALKHSSCPHLYDRILLRAENVIYHASVLFSHWDHCLSAVEPCWGRVSVSVQPPGASVWRHFDVGYWMEANFGQNLRRRREGDNQRQVFCWF